MSGSRNAPSVSYPVGRCPFWVLMLAALAMCIALVLGLAAADLPAWPRGLLGVLFVAWLVWAGISLARVPRGWLRWQRPVAQEAGWWTWSAGLGGSSGDEGLGPVSLHCVLDLQNRALLRLHGPRGVPRWVWLEQGSAPPDWLALRRAVLAHSARA